MAYNGGGLEDPQNWPFSVRYTASPYRKSKFPVDVGTVESSSSGHWSNTGYTNGNGTTSSSSIIHSQNQNQSQNQTNNNHHPHHNGHHQQQQQQQPQSHNNGSYPFQYMNTNNSNTNVNGGGMTNPGTGGPAPNNNHPFYHPPNHREHQHLLQEQQHQLQQQNSINGLCHGSSTAQSISHMTQQQQQQHQQQLQSHNYSILSGSTDHHHYGLPAPALHSIGTTNINSSDCHFFMRYPRHLRQNCTSYLNPDGNPLNQVDTILDEGYIEDLKQPYNLNGCNGIGTSKNNPISVGGSLGMTGTGVIGGGSGITSGFGSDNNNLDYDPYSYVYDSKIHEDLSVTSSNGVLCCGGNSLNEQSQHPQHHQQPHHPPNRHNHHNHPERDSSSSSMPGQFSSSSLIALSSSRNGGGCGVGGGSENENEYEEIRDVARYMNSHHSHHSQHPPLPRSPGGPLHFKSFSSTDDILAEVVQVQQRHDRVLDQLNLEVENLLISSSHEIVHQSSGGGSGSGSRGFGSGNMCSVNMSGQLDKMSSLSLNGIYQECYCEEIPSLPQFSSTGGGGGGCSLRPGGSGSGNVMSSLLFKDSHSGSSGSSSCCCGNGSTDLTAHHGRDGDEMILGVLRSRRSNSLTLSHSNGNGGGGPWSHHPHHALPSGNGKLSLMESTSLSSTCISATSVNLSGGNTMSRKKKLDRHPNNHLSDSNPKLQLSTHQHHHHILPPTSTSSMSIADKHQQQLNCKNRHHRSYSLIPHWKIREHLRRLPFLRQQNKLKKTEGPSLPTSASTIPISSSGQEFATNCKKMSDVMTSSPTTAAPTNKTRSSSMDELRATAPEEHWYSADSDTEPDSLTAIPESSPNQLNNGHGKSPSCLGSRLGGIGGNGGGTENGSRLDINNPIPDAKAPKFRRGTGLKDKWRESWSSTKTLSKPTMDEENKLLRWFSLRKNQANIEPPGGSSRHSTLPLLSEDDLKRISYIEEEEGYWPRRTVPPPTLPPPPTDLTQQAITRRHIVAAIVHSENSYVAALQRLVNEYKKPLERSHPAILSHSKISSIFHRVPEILQCHSLFRIALAECVRRWDADEKIGDVFVASFSKSLVLDVYSEFINNFGLAMETAKVEARRKSAFADFLKVKQMTAHDRLSLFGLMVKPVQRFPQFILLLQDLLKHTPKDHHDRMSLQLALTQLESLAAMLNERKRESEQYQAFRETIKSIGGGKFVLLRSVADDPNRILLRQDVVTQLEFDNSGAAVAKSKSRKLLLLNDMLICVALSQTGTAEHQQQHHTQQSSSSSSSSGNHSHSGSSDVNSNGTSGSNKAEKSVFKWSYPVRDVEVEDISISPTMSRFVHSGGNNNSNNTSSNRNGSFKSSASTGGNNHSNHSSTNHSSNNNSSNSGNGNLADEVNSTSISLLEEMQGLMHDYEVLSRVLTLVSSLKSPYEGLTESSVKELMLEIQQQIRCRDEQISYFDSSCLTLLLGTGNNRDKVVFQMTSPAARNEWIEELRLAQLALDPNNSPSWDIPPESPYPHHKLPLFVRSLSLIKSPNMATVKCGCFFTHTFVSPTGRSKILDYLWVSSTDGMSSHITAFRSQQNALKEVSSFDLVEEKINDLLFVLGHVWLATESRKIMVFDPADPEKGSVSFYLLSDSVLKLTQFEGCIYAGLANGTLAVFTQIRSPHNLKPEFLIKIGHEKVRSVFGSRDHVYAACGNAVVSIDIKTHTIERNVVLNHHSGPIAHMACSGVGLWITTEDSGTVCLYHLESLQHLQDVSIAPSVFRTVRDSFRRQKGCFVTCLTAHKGWLWIGTNLGVILTIPLPRLEGVPIISTGKANVSYHGYSGPVTFLMPLTKQPAIVQNHNPYIHQNSNSTSESAVVSSASKDTSANGSTNTNVNNVYPRNQSQTETPAAPKTPGSPRNVGSPVPPAPPTSAVTAASDSLDGKESQDKDNILKSPLSSKSSSLSFDGSTTELKECDSHNSSLVRTPSESGSGSELKDGLDASNLSSNSLTRTLSDTGSVGDRDSSMSKTLVVLRKKNSKDNVFMRNCKTLPRGGPLPLSLRFSIDSDVYGLYGNLINVRGLEEEGTFVDPLYDALRRSDPELVALDSKISTLDRRLKMRLSRPRSLDLSNWSVDSKISASSDESVGLGNRNSPAGTDPISIGQDPNHSSPVPPNSVSTSQSQNAGGGSGNGGINNGANNNNSSGTTKKTIGRQKKTKGQQERTVVVVVGGRGYINMRTQSPSDQLIMNNSENNSDSKHCAHLTVWQMKT